MRTEHTYEKMYRGQIVVAGDYCADWAMRGGVPVIEAIRPYSYSRNSADKYGPDNLLEADDPVVRAMAEDMRRVADKEADIPEVMEGLGYRYTARHSIDPGGKWGA